MRSQYELYDSVRFPFSYGISNEENVVEIIRISPQDARSLIDETDTAEKRRKLAGVQIHHFGGFFERHWRKNDLLWGRLDGAERIIETIVPPSAVRDRLLAEAQREIIREEFATDTNEPVRRSSPACCWRRSPAATRRDDAGAFRGAATGRGHLGQRPGSGSSWKAHYEVDRDLDRRRFPATLSRATSATGRVLDSVSGTYKGVKAPARWLSRVGRFSLYAVGASTPRSSRTCSRATGSGSS